ncbi:MAG TPA: hypothetical protein VEH29_03905 [Acidimicrobiales bacterium]|nr:hypothetical protein [Acidimicrobiales bacterium]
MRKGWRWTLRGVAVLAFAAGGVLLAVHPSARYPLETASIVPEPGHPTQHPTGLASCLSPFNRLTGTQQQEFPPEYIGPPLSLFPGMRSRLAACSAATNGREHAVDALGISGVLLVGVSFLPRRRVLAANSSPDPMNRPYWPSLR